MGLTLIPNGYNTPPHGPMPRMASRNAHRRVFGFSRSLTAIFSTVRSPFASRVGQGNHQQRDCELDSLLRFSLRRTAAFISANEPTDTVIGVMALGGKSRTNATAQIWGCAQEGNAGRHTYQGLGEWGNNVVGDGERITRPSKRSPSPAMLPMRLSGVFARRLDIS